SVGCDAKKALTDAQSTRRLPLIVPRRRRTTDRIAPSLIRTYARDLLTPNFVSSPGRSTNSGSTPHDAATGAVVTVAASLCALLSNFAITTPVCIDTGSLP